MLDILIFTLNSIIPVILLMALGYILRRTGFLNADFLKTGNKTVFFVLLPAMLFKNLADIDDISIIRPDVIAYVLAAIVILMIAGALSAKLVRDPRQKGVIHQCVFRSNFALIGVPLAELMGGSDGVVMAAVISLFSIPIFNVMAVIVLSIYRDGKVKINPRKILADIVRNPLIIGVLSGFAVAFTRSFMTSRGIRIPLSDVTFLSTAINFLSRAATPLSLIVLGGQFDAKRVSGYRKQISIGLIGRNIVAPLVGVGGAALLTVTGRVDFGPEVFSALIALFGTPVAVASAIMAEAMDNDGQLAGQLVVWTSILSLATLFVTIFASRALGLL